MADHAVGEFHYPDGHEMGTVWAQTNFTSLVPGLAYAQMKRW